MNPWIDVGLIAVATASLVMMWPYLKNLALLLEQIEDEHIARQFADERAWEESREDYNIHKSL